LELLLTFAIPQRDVLPLAKVLLLRFGDLPGVLAADPSELSSIEGIKSNTATLIKLVDWLRNAGKPAVPVGIQPAEEIGSRDSEAQLPDFKLEAPPVLTGSKKKPPPIRPRTDIFSQSVLREAIRILPTVPLTESMDEIRTFLINNLHFSSYNTRRRYVPYIIHRLFPAGKVDMPLLKVARALSGTPELQEICFYRFCRSEPLMPKVVRDLILPNMGIGRLPRLRILTYLKERYPEAKNLENCAKAVVDSLTDGGIVSSDRTQLTFTWRSVRLLSFAFVLHDEFANLGIYEIQKVETSPLMSCLLWAPEKRVKELYELRNQGLISKVSEIDTVRQFTLRYDLSELVQLIVAKGQTQ